MKVPRLSVPVFLAAAALILVPCVAALRRAPWLDRAAVAAATLLAADAWFDVVTSSGAAAVALATTEAIAVELPVALLCLWLVRAVLPRRVGSAPPATTTTTTTRSIRMRRLSPSLFALGFGLGTIATAAGLTPIRTLMKTGRAA